jgi:hypothetical protein
MFFSSELNVRYLMGKRIREPMIFSVMLVVIVVGFSTNYNLSYGSSINSEVDKTNAVETSIGDLPTHCVSGPEPMTVFNQVAPVIGSYPAWATMNGPKAQLIYTGDDTSPTEYGWELKFLWIMRNTYTDTVTVSGRNLETDQPIYFQLNNQTTPTETLLLKIADNNAFTFADFPGSIFIPTAGCYILEAKWEGGYWGANFSAGKIPDPQWHATMTAIPSD